MKTEIRVIRIPTKIECECPYCYDDFEISYSEFCDIVGEPCDWKYGKFNCPKCGKNLEIDFVDWD